MINRPKPNFGDLARGHIQGVSSYDNSKHDTPQSRNSPRKGNPLQIPFGDTKPEFQQSHFGRQNSYQPDQNIQYQPDQNIQYQPDQNIQYQPDQNIQYQPDQNIQYQPDQNIQYQPDQNIQYEAEYAYAMDPYEVSFHEPTVSDHRSQHAPMSDQRSQPGPVHGVPYYEPQQNFAHGDPYQCAHPAPIYQSQQYPGMNYQQLGESGMYWHHVDMP
jgi:hypothetical protein